MTLDFSFDRRIAAQYEDQRRHPPAVSQAVGEAIVRRVGTGGRVLELGVGTGRIARPTAAAGGNVVGIDLSADMLSDTFRQENFPSGSLTLTQGSIERLPFPDNSFDAVTVVHVLHLLQDWRQALNEAARVLKPRGLFIQGRDWTDPESVVAQLRDQMRRRVMQRTTEFTRPAMPNEIDDALRELGGRPDAAEETWIAEWKVQASATEILASMANRTHSESWVLPDDVLQPVVAELRKWSAQTWPDLDASQAVRRRFLLKAISGSW